MMVMILAYTLGLTWTYLHDLSVNQAQHWAEYLDQLNQTKQSRDPHTSIVQFV